MKPPVVIGPIAEREVEAAARWYVERQPGLGSLSGTARGLSPQVAPTQYAESIATPCSVKA